MRNKFIKNTFILILGGFITKIMGMIIKIIMTRNISESAMSMYMLTLPTYNLFITIVTFSSPISISKLVSEKKNDLKDILLNAFLISIIISSIASITLLLLSKPITVMLHNNKLYYPILSCFLSLPFIGISSVIKGYYFGENKMHIVVISNFIEQIIRIIMFIIVLPLINNEIYAVTFIVGSNLLSELVSLVTLSIFLPKSNISFKDIKINKNIIKEILNISIPSTTSKIIGVISYFFEPIILTNLLLLNGYTNDYISLEYGIINGYTIALLTLPSFFTNAISTSIIPVISNAYKNKNLKLIKKRIKEVIYLSLFIGISFTSIVLLKKEYIMELIYNTTSGVKYINFIAPFFILLYLEGPLSSILQSINKSKCILTSSIIGIIIKYILMIILSFLKFGIYSYIVPMIINIIIIVIINSYQIKKGINSF